MAEKKSRKGKAAAKSPPRTSPNRPRKIKVIEAEQPEHYEPMEGALKGKHAGKQGAQAEEREELRYGGIPLGSDARE